MEDVILYMDELQSNCSISHCRICHESEFESCEILEAPCSCSGTLKFAHRDCIQRWCHEKGNTTCEICLQRYEPGYMPPSQKSHLVDGMPTSDTLQIILDESEPQDETPTVTMMTADEYSQCISTADRNALYCRSFVISFTVILLVRHAFDVCTGTTQDYPFTLFTVLVLRVSGIILPMYLLIRIIGAVHRCIKIQFHRAHVINDESPNFHDDEANDHDDNTT